MNSIAIGIDPMIAHLGGFELRWYGLAIVAAVVVGIWVATMEAKRRGISADDIQSLGMWSVIGGIIGARLFHVLDKWEFYLANPHQILALQQGGLAIWGGVVGGVAVGAVYARRRKLPLAITADIGALGLITGQIIGRIGCLINGDAVGGPTTLPWGFRYVNPNAMLPQAIVDYAREQGRSVAEIAVQPYPLYDMVWNLGVLAILWHLRTRTRLNGLIFFTYVALYGAGRFVLSFVRVEDQIFLGLQQAQLIALGMMLAGIVAVVYLLGKSKKTALAGRALSAS
ncbi:MAG: prolipoprotein diacylglyceryl transferase [Chloroflexota bacterium]|nr:MAG: prolipoprotein diacylglyceryl transferase [Chloroflexota bacterium]